MTIAVLLAAGRGTRMGLLTADTPKPLLPVGGRPILVHILVGLRAAGVREAVVVTGWLGERIEAAIGDGTGLGLTVRYCRQTRPEGTARALMLAEPLLDAKPFLLGWGDILVDPGFYGEFLRAFAARPCDLQLAVNEIDDPWRGAAVDVDADWRVTRLEEKPPPGTATTRWNNAGLFAATPLLFDYARRVPLSARGEYELPTAIARMIADGRTVRACPVRGFWSDVGTPDDLAAAEHAFRRRPRTEASP